MAGYRKHRGKDPRANHLADLRRLVGHRQGHPLRDRRRRRRVVAWAAVSRRSVIEVGQAAVARRSECLVGQAAVARRSLSSWIAEVWVPASDRDWNRRQERTPSGSHAPTAGSQTEARHWNYAKHQSRTQAL